MLFVRNFVKHNDGQYANMKVVVSAGRLRLVTGSLQLMFADKYWHIATLLFCVLCLCVTLLFVVSKRCICYLRFYIWVGVCYVLYRMILLLFSCIHLAHLLHSLMAFVCQRKKHYLLTYVLWNTIRIASAFPSTSFLTSALMVQLITSLPSFLLSNNRETRQENICVRPPVIDWSDVSGFCIAAVYYDCCYRFGK